MHGLRRHARITVIALVALVGAQVAAAERLEIPLTELVGEWDGGYGSAEHGIAFTLPRLPTDVKWVDLRLRGSTFPGAMNCPIWDAVAEAEVPHTTPIPTYFTAYIPTVYGEWVVHSGPNGIGVFDRTFRFKRPAGSDRELSWNFLRGGRGEIVLYVEAMPVWNACEPVLPPSKISIDKAVLIVEGKFPKAKR